MSESAVIQFQESLNRETVQGVLCKVDEAVQAGSDPIILDLAPVENFDSAGMGAVLEGLRLARQQGLQVKLKGVSRAMLDFFSLVCVDRLSAAPSEVKGRENLVWQVGAKVEPMLVILQGIAGLALDVMRGVFVAPFRGKAVRLDRSAAETEMSALGALPIVCLIGFLLGLILAMQAYVQLRVWGAEIYMADMVGVSVLYEIGPLMTGIILAARSGSSNAAQLGSMVVSEEIDALRQMGVNPVRFLVIPKVLALSFSVLALCLVFDVVAMAGGALFAYGVAGIEPWAYKEQTQQALGLGSFFLASIKCVAFGSCIGVVSCSLGLGVKGGSEGVGRATTNAVVLSIFMIIILDAFFVAVQQFWPQ